MTGGFGRRPPVIDGGLNDTSRFAIMARSPRNGTRMGTSDTPPARPLYFINAVADFALVGGVSIVASLVLYSLYRTGTANERVIFITTQLSWMCNWPHFAASSYRLYHSRA